MSRVVTGGQVPFWVPCVLLLAAAAPVGAQAHQHDVPGLRIGAQALMLLTHATPALAGNDFTEGYITQPMLLGHASWSGLGARLTVNLEGWTLDRGELNAGNAGEGYVDRRHPHTFLHEAMVTAGAERAVWAASIAAGRGFVPYGTDDPMARLLAKYPANHHLAQILERWVVMAALRRGPVIVEAGLFNGDEPTAPQSLGRLSRLGDSWSARVTLLPLENIELQASHAQVESPEHAPGGGLDHRKWSASARATTERGYALIEWARTYEYSNGRRAFAFGSALGEASVELRALTVAARYERTTRPEEERLSDAFRSARPHADENIIGVTRWRIASLHVARAFDFGELHVAPFAEVSRLSVEEITGSIFDPVEHYGSDRQWSLSVGFRIGAGARHARMGRYGVAVPGN